MSIWVWTDGIGANFGGASVLISAARLSGKSGFRGAFTFDLIDDFLLDTFGERSGVSGFVGNIVRCHFRPNIIRFAFKSSKHSEHEHDVLSGNCLRVYASAEISHAISGRLPRSDVLGV